MKEFAYTFGTAALSMGGAFACGVLELGRGAFYAAFFLPIIVAIIAILRE